MNSRVMPPHSEVDPFSELGQVQLCRRRKRSRSISPSQLTSRSSDSSPKIGGSNRTSRSSSVSSEVRSPFSPVFETFAAVAKTIKKRNVPKPAIVSFHEAPDFLQFNPFIYRGYRRNVACTITCMKR